MSFSVIFIAITFLLTVHCWLRPTYIKTCVPRYHAWKPLDYCGYVPDDAYVAGFDNNGEKKYIARMVSQDNRSWVAPTTLSARMLPLRDESYSEILVLKPEGQSFETATLRGFGWRRTSKVYLAQLSRDCCLVEGATSYVAGKKVVTWIGRVMRNGAYYIGGVREAEWSIFYVHHPMMYLDEMGNSRGVSYDFEVLAYDCCTVKHCREANKADCCFDIMG